MVFIVVVLVYVLTNLQKSQCHDIQNYELKAKAVNYAQNVLNQTSDEVADNDKKSMTLDSEADTCISPMPITGKQ